MLGCRPADTPMESNLKLGAEEDCPPTEREQYQRLVGRLIYLTHTCLDIFFSASMVSKYMSDPKEAHMKAVYRILQYLKKAPGKGLHFKTNPSRNVGIFTDADWVGSMTDWRSISKYCSFV